MIHRQETGQVLLDVIPFAERLQERYRIAGKRGPVDQLGIGVIVPPTDLEQVHKLMSLPDDFECDDRVQHRLQADPCRDAGSVVLADGGNAIRRQRGTRLPAIGGIVIEERERCREGIARAEPVEIAQGPAPALGQDVYDVSVFMQDQDGFARQAQSLIKRLVWVAGETEQDRLRGFSGRRLAPKFAEEVRTAIRRVCEVFHLSPRRRWRVAVGAGVVATPVDVAGERGVFSRAARWFVDQLAIHGDRLAIFPHVVKGKSFVFKHLAV